MRSDAFMDVEAPWLEAMVDAGPERVRDLLLEAGVSVAQADGITGWLSDQRRGRRLHSKPTVVRYRAVLREVGSPQSHFPGYLPSRSLLRAA